MKVVVLIAKISNKNNNHYYRAYQITLIYHYSMIFQKNRLVVPFFLINRTMVLGDKKKNGF